MVGWLVGCMTDGRMEKLKDECIDGWLGIETHTR